MSKDPWIELPTGRRQRLSWINKDEGSRRRTLRRPYEAGEHPLCLCRDGGIPMGITRRSRGGEVYYLRPLHKGDPSRHAPWCPFRTEGAEEGGSQADPTIVKLPDGAIQVNLSSPARRLPEKVQARAASGVPGTERAGPSLTRRGKLLTLLETLWTLAELNSWWPWFQGKRHYGVVAYHLQRASAQVQIGKQPLAEHFYVSPPFPKGATAEQKRAHEAGLQRFLRTLAPDEQGRVTYGYIGGWIKQLEVTEEGAEVCFRHTRGRLKLDPRQWQRISKSWLPTDLKAAPTFALAKVWSEEDPPKAKALRVLEFASLELADTQTWLPVDSSYERRLALHLVSTERVFFRPLSALDWQGPLLPDFVLEDDADRTCLEVLGMMDDPEYAAHVEEKRLAYVLMGRKAWWWSPRAERDIPTLPPTMGRRE